MLKKQKSKKWILIVLAVLAAVSIAAAAAVIMRPHYENVSDILVLGDRYMGDFDFESAVLQYTRAIQIDPKAEEAYLKLADAYLALGDFENAIKALEDGYEATHSARILERLNELRQEAAGVTETAEPVTEPEPTETEPIPSSSANETETGAETEPETESAADTSVPEQLTLFSPPSKTQYYVGETLDSAGLTLTVTYDDGTTENVTDGFTCDVTAFDAAGVQTVTVTYAELTAEFSVTVDEAVLTGIEIREKPVKTAYYAGDSLDPAGLVLTAVYNSGHTEIVTSGFSCSPETFETVGPQKITVTYNGMTATFDVSVDPARPLGISINTLSANQTYFVGDRLDTTGLTLTARYENGGTETIAEGFACSPEIFDTLGEQIITVEYEGLTAQFPISVIDASSPVEFGGHRYRVIYDSEIGWHDARDACEEMGGHLATITSEEENLFVYDLVSRLGVSCWLGGTDEDYEGEWEWVTGEEWIYESSDFNNAEDRQHYLAINYHGSAVWDDQSEKDGSILCDTQGYVCEWE